MFKFKFLLFIRHVRCDMCMSAVCARNHKTDFETVFERKLTLSLSLKNVHTPQPPDIKLEKYEQSTTTATERLGRRKKERESNRMHICEWKLTSFFAGLACMCNVHSVAALKHFVDMPKSASHIPKQNDTLRDKTLAIAVCFGKCFMIK